MSQISVNYMSKSQNRDEHFITKRLKEDCGCLVLECNCGWLSMAVPRQCCKMMRLHLEGLSDDEIDDIMLGIENGNR
jgi:hypothetical protein